MPLPQRDTRPPRQSPQGEALLDFTTLFKTYVEYVVGHSRVYYAKTDFPREEIQYLTYRPIKIHKMDRGGITRFESDGRAVVSANYVIDIELVCYKEYYLPEDGNTPAQYILPSDVLSDIQHTLEHRQVAYHFFNRHRAGHLRSGDIDDRSVPLSDVNWEDRARCIMQFHMVIEDVESTFDPDIDGWIQTVDFDSVEREKGPVYRDCTVSYPPLP